jgi:hypothetical protein
MYASESKKRPELELAWPPPLNMRVALAPHDKDVKIFMSVKLEINHSGSVETPAA